MPTPQVFVDGDTGKCYELINRGGITYMRWLEQPSAMQEVSVDYMRQKWVELIRYIDTATNRTYSLVVDGGRLYQLWDDTRRKDEVVDPQAFLTEEWEASRLEPSKWTVYKPLQDTFQFLPSLVALATIYLPWWEEVFEAYGRATRKLWSYNGFVTGGTEGYDFGNKVYHLALLCAVQLRKDRGLRPLTGLHQEIDGTWRLNPEKGGDILEGMMGSARENLKQTQLDPEDFWRKLRQDVEVVVWRVKDVWDEPKHARTWDVNAMVEPVLRSAGGTVTINLPIDEVDQTKELENKEIHQKSFRTYRLHVNLVSDQAGSFVPVPIRKIILSFLSLPVV